MSLGRSRFGHIGGSLSNKRSRLSCRSRNGHNHRTDNPSRSDHPWFCESNGDEVDNSEAYFFTLVTSVPIDSTMPTPS
jgi:hypothetical protein